MQGGPYGFRLGSRQLANEAELREFIETDVVTVADVNATTATHFADILIELRRAGTAIPTNDVWIAAVAASSGATVVTYDEHFRAIGRIASIIL